jgi:hypothetical protein
MLLHRDPIFNRLTLHAAAIYHPTAPSASRKERNMTVSLTMLSPLPAYLDESGPHNRLASRPPGLDGRIVGLLPNWRPSAVEILRAIGALLEERYCLKALVMEQPVRELPIRTGKLLDTMHSQLDELAKRVDVVITATGD